MRIIGCLFLATLLTACGTTGKVLTLGPDTYRISATKHNLSGGAPEAEANALQSAESFCTSRGKQLLVSNMSSGFDRPFYTYTATFRCLALGDPDLRRPVYQSAPDMVIQTRP